MGDLDGIGETMKSNRQLLKRRFGPIGTVCLMARKRGDEMNRVLLGGNRWILSGGWRAHVNLAACVVGGNAGAPILTTVCLFSS